MGEIFIFNKFLLLSKGENANLQTSHCNEKKLLAKTVSEKSSELFFGSFVHRCGPFSERAVVMNVLDQSFDAMVFKYGIVKRIYLEVSL